MPDVWVDLNFTAFLKCELEFHLGSKLLNDIQRFHAETHHDKSDERADTLFHDFHIPADDMCAFLE